MRIAWPSIQCLPRGEIQQPTFTLLCLSITLFVFCDLFLRLQRAGWKMFTYLYPSSHFSLHFASLACEFAAQATKLAGRFNSLSELQWGTGTIEQTNKQTWLLEVWEWQEGRAQLSGLLKHSLIWGKEPKCMLSSVLQVQMGLWLSHNMFRWSILRLPMMQQLKASHSNIN